MTSPRVGAIPSPQLDLDEMIRIAPRGCPALYRATPFASKTVTTVVSKLALLLVSVVAVGCRAATPAAVTAPAPAAAPGSVAAANPLTQPVLQIPAVGGDSGGVARARADSARLAWTTADVDFMTGMIGHHAQAIYISRWAESHGASPSVRTLTGRIINAQADEITLMATWLRDRLQPVPEPTPLGMKHVMDGMEHVMAMPGMLTEAQLKELDAARGADFDRLFLTYMIQHHSGAVEMVKTLFATPGAGQDETIFKFASDVNVDQTTEIARMQRMLFSLKLQQSGTR